MMKFFIYFKKILNQWNEIIEIKTVFSLSVGTFNDLKLCIEIK